MKQYEMVTNGRRDELTIMTHLLANTFEAKRLTHLLYGTNLSYTRLRKYLTSLLRMGLIEEINEPYHSFRITDKGRKFIELVQVVEQ
jgi:predicted transcriptional regulator